MLGLVCGGSVDLGVGDDPELEADALLVALDEAKPPYIEPTVRPAVGR